MATKNLRAITVYLTPEMHRFLSETAEKFTAREYRRIRLGELIQRALIRTYTPDGASND